MRLVGGKRNPLAVLHVAALRLFIAFAHWHGLPGDVGGEMFSGVYQAQARLHSRNFGPGRAVERAGAGRGRQKFYQPGYSRHRESSTTEGRGSCFHQVSNTMRMNRDCDDAPMLRQY